MRKILSLCQYILCILVLLEVGEARARARVTLQSVTISPTSSSIQVGQQQQFTETAHYSNGTTTNVTTSATWSSSNTLLATVSGGLATGKAAGTVTITGVFSGKTATASLTVTSSGTNTTVVNFDNPTCPGGNNGAPFSGSYAGINWGSNIWDCEVVGLPLDATASASWASPINQAVFSFLSPSVLTSLKVGSTTGNGIITFTSDQGEQASVSVTGGAALVTLNTGFTKQATTITVDSGVSWSIEIDDLTYSTGPVISVNVSPTSATLVPGAQQQFTATVVNSTNQNVTWNLISGTGTLSSTGLFTAPNISCGGETDTVGATSQADTTKTGTATATITATAPTNHTVDLSWNDPDTVTFNIYRGTASGGPYTKIATGLNSPNYLDTVTGPQTFYYVVTAVDTSNNESAFSNEAQAVIPCP